MSNTMLPKIVKVDFVEGANVWVVRLRLPDGRYAQAQLGPNSFTTVRGCHMGQFMLQAWLTRASVLPEVQATAK